MSEKVALPEKAQEGVRDKRKAIIAAAREIFARQGYETTTIAEVAAAAGVAVGTVYLYFHNKREIYVETSLGWVDEITAALVKPEVFLLPIRQIPRTIIETSFDLCRANKTAMTLFQLDIQSQEESKKLQHNDESLIQAIDSFLSQYMARGDFLPFDTKMYAKILFNLVHGVLYDCFCKEGGANEELYREQTIEVIERLFFGPALLR